MNFKRHINGLIAVSITLTGAFALIGVPKLGKDSTAPAIKAMAKKIEAAQCNAAKGSSTIEILCGCLAADEDFIARFETAAVTGERKDTDLNDLRVACQSYYAAIRSYTSAVNGKNKRQINSASIKLKKEITSVMLEAEELEEFYKGSESVFLSDLSIFPFQKKKVFKDQLPDKTALLSKAFSYGKGILFAGDYAGSIALEKRYAQLLIAPLLFSDLKKGKVPDENLKISTSSGVAYYSAACGADKACLEKPLSIDLTDLDSLTFESSGSGSIGLPDARLLCVLPDCSVPSAESLHAPAQSLAKYSMVDPFGSSISCDISVNGEVVVEQRPVEYDGVLISKGNLQNGELPGLRTSLEELPSADETYTCDGGECVSDGSLNEVSFVSNGVAKKVSIRGSAAVPDKVFQSTSRVRDVCIRIIASGVIKPKV